jgi:nucleotide-binding universal stress UspA family protein
MKTIVAAVDFSEISETVVTEAVELAQEVQGRLVLVSVVQPPIVATEYAPFVENLDEIAAAADASISKRLKDVQQRVAASHIDVEAVQHHGAPVFHIVDEAKSRHADFIVMGSHGHNAFYDLLVGSTTHGVLLRAPCPVVIVPPKAGRRAAAQAA